MKNSENRMSEVKSIVDQRIRYYKKGAKKINKSLSKRDLSIIKTNIEMRICTELNVKYLDYCINIQIIKR